MDKYKDSYIYRHRHSDNKSDKLIDRNINSQKYLFRSSWKNQKVSWMNRKKSFFSDPMYAFVFNFTGPRKSNSQLDKASFLISEAPQKIIVCQFVGHSWNRWIY